MSTSEKKSIKSIALGNLLKVFLLAILIMAIVVTISYQSFFTLIAQNKALTTAEIVKAGLTSHMKMGAMDKRDYFLNEISSMYDINSIKIIRAKVVDNQFGLSSTPFEEKMNPNIENILALKKPHFEWESQRSKIDAIIPYIASSKGNLNCLECHNVEEGTVLGAVHINMGMQEYQSFIYQYSYIVAFILLAFAVAIIINMYHVIEKYIQKPLLNIIDDGQRAYKLKKELYKDSYESKEFSDVIANINTFNSKIIKREDELHHKNIELQNLNNEIESTLKETMHVMGRIEEIRSDDTKYHTKRVTVLSGLIAKELGFNDEDIALTELGSALHDIGKIGIADAILNKPAKLNTQEFEIMKTHAELGYDILRHSNRKVLQIAASIAHEHHEKYDGTGYPQGLKGEDISIYARIVAVVDVLDALLAKRVYKEPWDPREVITLIQNERGKHFDPIITDIVLKNIHEYVKLIYKMSEKSKF
jgi:response regulator RpfG family c-di-GMP phosphodiesterase